MNYVSLNSLADIVRDWTPTLPRELDLVVGVPRSGMLVATQIALHRNLPLIDVDGFVEGRAPTGGARIARREDAAISRALVVDDSLANGGAMREVRNAIARSGRQTQCLYGAAIVSPGRERELDVWAVRMEAPRIFEWNLYHHALLRNTCMDIDGVLCADPSSDQNDDGIRYARFVEQADPLNIPTVFVGTLVTNRLERYRSATERWLTANGVTYGRLVMHPAATAQERTASADHSARKATAYLESPAHLFIESSLHEAVGIARITKRPVYCVEVNAMIDPKGDAVGPVIDPQFAQIRRIVQGVRRRAQLSRR